MEHLIQLINTCESEQLHLSGAIQGAAGLLRVDEASGQVTHASANIAEFVGQSAEGIIGRPLWELGELLTAQAAGAEEGQGIGSYGLSPRQGPVLDVRSVRHQGGIILEVEAAAQERQLLDQSGLQRPLLQLPSQDAEVSAYHSVLLAGIWSLTGYDRIMIYRFHDDWSGEVIAERTSPAFGSYMHLRFPASDIPAVARNLYLINAYRHIPSISAATIDILGHPEMPLDLTYSDQRSVSPVHLQYLSNMGVGASFSVPIRIAGKLWGLVACHHLTPRRISLLRRMACANLVGTFSLGLSSYQAGRRMRTIDQLDRRVDRILEEIASQQDPLDGVARKGDAIMKAMHADGFAMALGDEVVAIGDAPGLESLEDLDRWFTGQLEENQIAIENLSVPFPENTAMTAIASGAVCIKAQSPRSGIVRFYWFRAEEPYEVLWAGNPDKPMVENASALMLSPRRSFEKWTEKRTGFCRPWTNEDRMVAAKFRNLLLRWL